jgi:hypothetical protein
MGRVRVSFDVGIIHMGLFVGDYDEASLCDENVPVTMYMIEMVDLTQLRHERVKRSECKLQHSNHIVDRMAHFFQEYEPQFQEFGEVIDVMVEQQPITGIGSVESLIIQKYRDIITVISPVSMHKWAGISHLEYDQRKQAVTAQITEVVPKEFTSYHNEPHKFDMADALMLFLFEISRRQTKAREIQAKTEREGMFARTQKATIPEFFEQFRHEKQSLM